MPLPKDAHSVCGPKHDWPMKAFAGVAPMAAAMIAPTMTMATARTLHTTLNRFSISTYDGLIMFTMAKNASTPVAMNCVLNLDSNSRSEVNLTDHARDRETYGLVASVKMAMTYWPMTMAIAQQADEPAIRNVDQVKQKDVAGPNAFLK